MYLKDVNLAKEALDNAMKLIDSRMSMSYVERIDDHPLSWPVATEYQKMKRAQSDGEDDKIFAAAEKKVKEERTKKSDEAKQRQIAVGKQRMNFVPKASYGKFGKGF